jgi:hypothetical protein
MRARFDEEAVTHAASFTFSENEQQIICCGARFRRGGEDRPIVLLEEQQPAGDVFGIAQLPLYSEVSAQKGCAQLGNEFLGRICLRVSSTDSALRHSCFA